MRSLGDAPRSAAWIFGRGLQTCYSIRAVLIFTFPSLVPILLGFGTYYLFELFLDDVNAFGVAAIVGSAVSALMEFAGFRGTVAASRCKSLQVRRHPLRRSLACYSPSHSYSHFWVPKGSVEGVVEGSVSTSSLARLVRALALICAFLGSQGRTVDSPGALGASLEHLPDALETLPDALGTCQGQF